MGLAPEARENVTARPRVPRAEHFALKLPAELADVDDAGLVLGAHRTSLVHDHDIAPAREAVLVRLIDEYLAQTHPEPSRTDLAHGCMDRVLDVERGRQRLQMCQSHPEDVRDSQVGREGRRATRSIFPTTVRSSAAASATPWRESRCATAPSTVAALHGPAGAVELECHARRIGDRQGGPDHGPH
ncbi:MAG: hypothetical protein U0869_04745 [Chloroflexota bacterium]